jgi:hypothetical protein
MSFLMVLATGDGVYMFLGDGRAGAGVHRGEPGCVASVRKFQWLKGI